MARQTATGPENRIDHPSHLEQFASYEDGSDLVICDRKSPSGWIRSDVTVDVEP